MDTDSAAPADASAAPAFGDYEHNPELAKGMVPSLRHLWPQLLVAGVLPFAAYAVIRPHVSSDATGLAIVMVFPLAEIAWERRRRGNFEPIGMIALIGIVIGLLGALVFQGNSLLLKIRESVLTGAFGVLCFASLFARRPTMFYLGRSFATGNDKEKMAEFDRMWELPTMPRRFRIVTIVWGTGLVLEAVARTVMALTLPTQVFLGVAQVLGWTVIGGLLWWTMKFRNAGEDQIVSMLEADAAVGGPDAAALAAE